MGADFVSLLMWKGNSMSYGGDCSASQHPCCTMSVAGQGCSTTHSPVLTDHPGSGHRLHYVVSRFWLKSLPQFSFQRRAKHRRRTTVQNGGVDACTWEELQGQGITWYGHSLMGYSEAEDPRENHWCWVILPWRKGRTGTICGFSQPQHAVPGEVWTTS